MRHLPIGSSVYVDGRHGHVSAQLHDSVQVTFDDDGSPPSGWFNADNVESED